MARTTATAVKEILQTSLTEAQLMAYVNDADQWVSENLATLSPAPSAATLEIIERYIACALTKLREIGVAGALTSVSIGDVTEAYGSTGASGDALDYMIRAAGFDVSGTVRRHFLAPRPVAAPVPPTYGAKTRVGKGFIDDVSS